MTKAVCVTPSGDREGLCRLECGSNESGYVSLIRGIEYSVRTATDHTTEVRGDGFEGIRVGTNLRRNVEGSELQWERRLPNGFRRGRGGWTAQSGHCWWSWIWLCALNLHAGSHQCL